MRIAPLVRLTLGLTALSLIVAACGSESAAPTSPPAAPTTAPQPTAAPPQATATTQPTATPRPTPVPPPTATPVPVPEGQLTIALSTMASFELIQIAGSPERQYLDSLYDYVIGATDKGELDTVSGLANSFTISADGTSFTIKTRTGVTFHNGDAASAKDVLDRLNVARLPAHAAAPPATSIQNSHRLSRPTIPPYW